jgi:hypothetical protein
VEENIDKHAWYLASFVPKAVYHGRRGTRNETCWARDVLVQYGDREDVRRNLMANFSTEGWWGPESLYLLKKKQELLEFRKDEDNQYVLLWIDEYIAGIDQSIERAQIIEERDDF